MASFTVRVELHDGGPHDYERLHVEMAQSGFARTIRADDGRFYHMPPGEYDFQHLSRTAADVHALAVAARERTGRAGNVLVTETVQRVFSLEPVAPSPVQNALAAIARQARLSPQPSNNALRDLDRLLGARPRSILDGLN